MLLNNNMTLFLITLALVASVTACNTDKKTDRQQTGAADTAKAVNVPAFNADSAYAYIAKQLSFGPRVPNTKAHRECGDWLVKTLQQYTPTVIEQKVTLRAFNGTALQSRNIIASFNPESNSRVLLCSHWDSRPWADHDPDAAMQKKPVPAANDGASGVGVLIEIARQMHLQNPGLGVDIVLFDAEDYGEPQDQQGTNEDSWALGSQYWAANPHVPNYSARFGILLDMVGGQGATFPKEQISMYYAPNIVQTVWSTAERLGYGSLFNNENSGPITDDHLYVNKIMNTPMIDIIDYQDTREKGFNDQWHTTHDDLTHISKETLKGVGQTVITVVYEAK